MPKSDTQLTNLGVKYRGAVIAHCIGLEKEIEFFITRYFTDDVYKANVMWEIFLDRFHFDGKISVFENLIKISCDKEFFKKNHSKLFSELRYVKDERNKFAHYIQLVTGEPTDSITLLNFRDGVKSIHYSPENFKQLIKRIEKCTSECKKMNKKIHKFFPAQ